MKKTSLLLALLILGWFLLHMPAKAHWKGQLATDDPEQTSENLPSPWHYKNFTVTPKAKYHIKAIVLSKHSYWAGETEDSLAPYDLALGWGALSDAKIINQLKISQSGRWYEYRWAKNPPLDPLEIISHSSNNHIIPADNSVLQIIKNIKKYDFIDLEGYLVNIETTRKDWHWDSSLSRTDTQGGACELIWVTHCLVVKFQ